MRMVTEVNANEHPPKPHLPLVELTFLGKMKQSEIEPRPH
jgi:hypothetical protein